MRWPCRVIAGVLLTLPFPAQAADSYFVTIFSAETVPFRSVYTHTFIVVTRIPEPVNGVPQPVEQHHISWFPQNRMLRGLTLLPERGLNLPVSETFVDCRDNGMRVSMWGPYHIHPELFCLMKAQRAKLESGRVRYKPTDNLYHSDCAANCYHAIWKPIAPLRKYSGAFNCGDASGAMTVKLFSPWIIDPCTTYDAILDLIVPPGEKVFRRSFDDRPGRVDAIRSSLR
ncbi:MAG: hypothetical protein L0241_22100 [Planctomycetia bacterium]|nr:hypothetical protein [Planctomycetia bacterium]